MQKLLLLACFLLNHALSYLFTVEALSRSKMWGQLTNRQGQFFLDLTQYSSESGPRTWQIIKVDHISWLLQCTISSAVPMTQQVQLWSVQDQEFRLLIETVSLTFQHLALGLLLISAQISTSLYTAPLYKTQVSLIMPTSICRNTHAMLALTIAGHIDQFGARRQVKGENLFCTLCTPCPLGFLVLSIRIIKIHE